MSNATQRVMLLIDGDNVSLDVVEQAVAQLLAEYGALHVRRAYCTAETALKQQTAYKRLGIRPMVNLAAGKNSTDIALAVDALDLVLALRPDVVVIASSDSDFAPLVNRLREKGCRVRGIGQQGKTGAETLQAYDDFVVLTHRSEAAAGTAGRAGKTAAKRAPARRSTRAPARAPARAAAKHAPPTVWPAAVQQVLDAVPALAGGEAVSLNVVVEALRTAKVLAKNASSIKLLQKYPDAFELDPPQQPQRVRLVRRTA